MTRYICICFHYQNRGLHNASITYEDEYILKAEEVTNVAFVRIYWAIRLQIHEDSSI